MRSKADAIATVEAIEPTQLFRLQKAHELMHESKETWEAQSRRRDEAAAMLVEAGATYADVARIIDATPERARQIVARHFEVEVNELNPQKRKGKPAH